jgi:hypothetical protein
MEIVHQCEVVQAAKSHNTHIKFSRQDPEKRDFTLSQKKLNFYFSGCPHYVVANNMSRRHTRKQASQTRPNVSGPGTHVEIPMTQPRSKTW